MAQQSVLQRIADDARAGHKSWQVIIAELAEHLGSTAQPAKTLGTTNTVPPFQHGAGWKPA